MIKENISLKPYNTFRVDVRAKQFETINNADDLKALFAKGIFSNNYLVIGGGSNILFTKDFDGIVLKIDTKGKELLEENDSFVRIKIAAGEEFDEIVKWTVRNNWVGIQNLALIPGSVGATPVQNVGAYGVEIKDVLESVEYFDIKDGDIKTILASDCKFGYRDSIFKHELKNKAIILSITIKLEKLVDKEVSEKYLSYGDIIKYLDEQYTKPYSLGDLYTAICEIRKVKLPDIKEYGSCGSTFQNPMIAMAKYEEIKKQYSEIPSFPTEDPGLVKIPAAYILERLGWKNKRIGDCGTWTHPLIVTNYGNATAEEILSVISQMQEDFFNDIGVKLETEINII